MVRVKLLCGSSAVLTIDDFLHTDDAKLCIRLHGTSPLLAAKGTVWHQLWNYEHSLLNLHGQRECIFDTEEIGTRSIVGVYTVYGRFDQFVTPAKAGIQGSKRCIEFPGFRLSPE
jgi:hypothetical protein